MISMDAISPRKIHFAPYVRQQRALDRLLKEGRARDVTELMRRAVDCYLDRLGRPSLVEQARQMAEDFHRDTHALAARADADALQNPARASDETW